MTTLAVLTASYKPDFKYFVDLHSSVLRNAGHDIVHHVAVPNRDVDLFSGIGSDRLVIHPINELMPRSFLSTYPVASVLRNVPRISMAGKVEAISLTRPWPPVRGWMVQQIVKLAIASQIDAEVLLLVDSDVALIRPISIDDFFRSGAVRFYRLPDGISGGMPRHRAWHKAANRLLGLDPTEVDSSTDYVTSFLTWDTRIVRRMVRRVQESTGGDWRVAVARQLDFSECFLYGVYLDRFGTPSELSFTRPRTLCHSHWGTEPLSMDGAADFVASVGRNEVAVHVQSKSGTEDDVRRFILRESARTTEG